MKYFSLFTGIGGFELGIEQAYELLRDAHRGSVGGSEEDTQGEERQGLFTKEGQDTSSETGSFGAITSDIAYERPLCVGYSEIDKHAISIYQSHFPDHKNYGDITKINEKELPDFDLLVGGFPCQAFSIAGKRKGFADVRGTLFFDIRIESASSLSDILEEHPDQKYFLSSEQTQKILASSGEMLLTQ